MNTAAELLVARLSASEAILWLVTINLDAKFRG
jgi:hypothetical protein